MSRKGIFVLALMSFLVAGCGVSKDKYMRIEDEKKDLERTVERAKGEKEELSRLNEDLQTENRRLQKEQAALRQKQEQAPSHPAEASSDESLLK